MIDCLPNGKLFGVTFGNIVTDISWQVAHKKRPQTSVKTKVISSRKAASSLPGLSHTRGKIRLKFGIQRGPTSSSLTMLTSKTVVIPDKVSGPVSHCFSSVTHRKKWLENWRSENLFARNALRVSTSLERKFCTSIDRPPWCMKYEHTGTLA